MINIPNEAMTHSGRFHADDVFSSALLRILNPKIKIRRVRVVPEDYNGIVFDIEGGEYDHHGENMSIRDNGIPYASFGLLWKQYGEQLVSKESVYMFDRTFIQPLDIQDNQGGNNLLARAITQANPNWDSKKSSDECFFKAIDIAQFILQNEIDSMNSANRAKTIVKEALRNQHNGIVVLNIGVPWKNILIPQKIFYVVYPSNRGGFNAQAVPIDFETQQCKIPFPLLWRGKKGQELSGLIGIENMNFCHVGGYLLNANTKEGAIDACKLSLEISNGNK